MLCDIFYRQLHFRSEPRSCLLIFENVLETELTLTSQKRFNVSSWPELSFGTPKDLREIKIILETLDEIWQNLRLRPKKIAYK